ncbi:MAG: sporulation protein [Sandaracinus sp.]
MGLFDMFGAGGGTLSIQPVSPHVTPGQALVGNVVFQGGGRAQQINALTIKLTQETRTMQMTNQGPQPHTESRELVPATPVTQPFQSTPGQPTMLPFQLQVPPGLPNSTPNQVTYHLRVTADIPGEIDPGASLEIQVVGGAAPMQAGMPGMQPGMPGMPGMMQPGMMQPGMMQPGMMQPGMMQPGMMRPA